jgi:hypothetical protein
LGQAGPVDQHGVVSDDRTPLEQAVELAVYAPLGFALEAKKLLPTFVERGRQQVQMAKMIGQFAVKQGQTEAEKRVAAAQAQAESILTEFGLVPVRDARPKVTAVPDHGSAGETAGPTPRARSGASAATLAIADYDSLAASQVIPRLGGLSPEELEAVRTYELAHRGRKTILGKLAQLTGE